MEVLHVKGTVVIKPKKLVDADDVLTPEEEAIVRKGERQLRTRESKAVVSNQTCTGTLNFECGRAATQTSSS